MSELFNSLKNEYGSFTKEFKNYNQNRLLKEIQDFQNLIKEENKNIADIENQIIITNPYFYHTIDGCLHKFGAEIGGHLVKDVRYTIAMFTGWDNRVLNSHVNGLY